MNLPQTVDISNRSINPVKNIRYLTFSSLTFNEETIQANAPKNLFYAKTRLILGRGMTLSPILKIKTKRKKN